MLSAGLSGCYACASTGSKKHLYFTLLRVFWSFSCNSRWLPRQSHKTANSLLQAPPVHHAVSSGGWPDEPHHENHQVVAPNSTGLHGLHSTLSASLHLLGNISMSNHLLFQDELVLSTLQNFNSWSAPCRPYPVLGCTQIAFVFTRDTAVCQIHHALSNRTHSSICSSTIHLITDTYGDRLMSAIGHSLLMSLFNLPIYEASAGQPHDTQNSAASHCGFQQRVWQ